MAYFEELRNEVSEIKEAYGSGRDFIRNALQRCYKLFFEIRFDAPKQKALLKLFREQELKSTKDTDAATKLVRLCIVQDAKRANPYAQVFRRATAADVEPVDFLNWIDKHGGIERVRLSKVPLTDATGTHTVSWDQIAEGGEEYISKQPSLAKMSCDGSSTLTFEGHTALLLVRRRTDDPSDPLNVVEVFSGDDARYRSVLRKYFDKANEPKGTSSDAG